MWNRIRAEKSQTNRLWIHIFYAYFRHFNQNHIFINEQRKCLKSKFIQMKTVILRIIFLTFVQTSRLRLVVHMIVYIWINTSVWLRPIRKQCALSFLSLVAFVHIVGRYAWNSNKNTATRQKQIVEKKACASLSIHSADKLYVISAAYFSTDSFHRFGLNWIFAIEI